MVHELEPTVLLPLLLSNVVSCNVNSVPRVKATGLYLLKTTSLQETVDVLVRAEEQTFFNNLDACSVSVCLNSVKFHSNSNLTFARASIALNLILLRKLTITHENK